MDANMVRLTVDGTAVEVPEGTTILDAAASVGIHIPTLCFLRGVSNIGMCRVCSVEVEGVDGLVSSCNTPVREGMVVTTSSERVVEYRKLALGLILAEHGLNSTNYCFSCPKNGACELQAVCREVGVSEPLYQKEPTNYELVDSNPFLQFNPNLCIHCQRCVGACNNLAFNHTLQAGKMGTRTSIGAPFGPNWKATTCESCGMCASACPTGAITEKRRQTYRSWETKKTRTTCPFCAVGCQLDLVTKGNTIVDAEPADGPSNHNRLCVKGHSGSFDFVSAPDRITTPLIKNHETGEFEPASWDDALNLVAERFGAIKQQYGGDALAGFACSRSCNEDIYMFQKMVRCAFGTNSVDNCARV